MDIVPELHQNEEFIQELQDCAKQLSEKLASDDYKGASELIGRLMEARDKNMFNAVGKLTRGLHDAIVNFNVDGDFSKDPPDICASEIKDASERLNHVIETTRAAADKTMDMVEASAPIAQNLSEEASALQEEWRRLRSREMSPEEFREAYHRIDAFFVTIREGTDTLNKNLQDIILEQGFQDLTGQVLTKVIGLICEVESSLVDLVRVAGQVEQVTGMQPGERDADVKKTKSNIEAEGPQIHADKREDVVANQDEVDDLLSSLGF